MSVLADLELPYAPLAAERQNRSTDDQSSKDAIPNNPRQGRMNAGDWRSVSVAVLLLPLALPLLRGHPRILWIVAVTGCIASFTVPEGSAGARSATFVTLFVFLKSLQAAFGHEKPRDYLDFAFFLLMPVVVRWDTPRRPSVLRASWSVVLGACQVLIVRAFAGELLGLRNPVAIVIGTQLALYLLLAGWANVAVSMLRLRGLDYDAPFRSPILARTPAEFWGRRWNTWVSYMLHRYVFVPAGGRRHPIRGTLSAFAVSGLYHEAGALMFVGRVTGGLTLYFLLQGVVVAATSRSQRFRRLAHRIPFASGAITLTALLASGVVCFLAIDGVDPARTWQRCCAMALK